MSHRLRIRLLLWCTPMASFFTVLSTIADAPKWITVAFAAIASAAGSVKALVSDSTEQQAPPDTGVKS